MAAEKVKPIMEELARKKRSVSELLKQKILVSPEFLAAIDELGSEELKKIAAGGAESVLVINKDIDELLKLNEMGINWLELERSKVLSEKRQNPAAYGTFLAALLSPVPGKSGKPASSAIKPEIAPKINPGASGQASTVVRDSQGSQVKVVFSYSAAPVKREMGDFVNYYLARFKAVQGVLMQHSELSGLVQISRLKSWAAGGSEPVSVIGMVADKRQTKQGHLAV